MGSRSLPDLAVKANQAIECVAPDGSTSHIAPLKLFGCDEIVWLEWWEAHDTPRETELFDGVYQQVKKSDARLVPYEQTRFEKPPIYE